MGDRRYFVYIMVSNSLSTMYIGVTNDLGRRAFEHRSGMGSEFAHKYRVTRLVYVEEYEDPTEATLERNSSRDGSESGRMSWSALPVRIGGT